MTTESAIRQREWRRRRRANRRQVCASCSNIFTPGRSDQAFRDTACAQGAYRRRKASGETGPTRPAAAPWLASGPAVPPNTGATADGRPGPALGPARPKPIDVRALIG
jgi:hypothetical protein